LVKERAIATAVAREVDAANQRDHGSGNAAGNLR
jgi:hypothetical protein